MKKNLLSKTPEIKFQLQSPNRRVTLKSGMNTQKRKRLGLTLGFYLLGTQFYQQAPLQMHLQHPLYVVVYYSSRVPVPRAMIPPCSQVEEQAGERANEGLRWWRDL